MSMIQCDACREPFDTDLDVEAHDEKTDKWTCRACRIEAEEAKRAQSAFNAAKVDAAADRYMERKKTIGYHAATVALLDEIVRGV